MLWLLCGLWSGLASADSLRLLVAPQTQAEDIAHAERLARAMGRQAFRVHVASQDRLIAALIRNEGDLIAQPLILEEQWRQNLTFSEAQSWTRSILVGQPGQQQTDNPRVLVHPGGPHWSRLVALREQTPPNLGRLELVPAPARMSTRAMQQAVADGEAELAAIWAHELDPESELAEVLALSEALPIAQLLRADQQALAAAVDAASLAVAVVGDGPGRALGDLNQIKERGRLRIVTVAAPGSYLPVDGRLRGFEYDLLRDFARTQGLALEVVVAAHRDQLLDILVAGGADVAAAFLTPTARLRAQGVTFTRPYHEAGARVMMLAGNRCPVHATDLEGMSLLVPAHSGSLNELQGQAAELNFKLLQTDPLTGVPGLIEAAERDGAQGVIVDEHLAAANRAWRDDVLSCVRIGSPQPHAWAVRIRDQQLLESLNQFIARSSRNGLLRLRWAEYFQDHDQMQAFGHAYRRYHQHGHLTDFDPLVRRHAARSGFDWRLILAQISEESGFDPNAVSSAGAQGLMQLKPTTARDVGVGDLHDPENSIRAGIAYMRWLWERFEPELSPDDRLWFTLASYNAGLAQVRIARQVARQRGLDARRWFGHVETTISDARGPDLDAGLARLRGGYAVRYVRDVQMRYRAYAGLLDVNAPRGMAPSVLAAGGH